MNFPHRDPRSQRARKLGAESKTCPEPFGCAQDNLCRKIASLKAQTSRTGWVMEMEIELGTQPCSAGRHVNALLISPLAIGCQVGFGGCEATSKFFHHSAQQSRDESRKPYFTQ